MLLHVLIQFFTDEAYLMQSHMAHNFLQLTVLRVVLDLYVNNAIEDFLVGR